MKSVEQKLFNVIQHTESKKELEKLMSEGWKIAQISAAGTSLSTECWILLEREYPHSSAGPR